MRSHRWLGAVVFVLALAIRVAYVVEDADVLGLDVSRLDQTDNYVFAQWARIIADGDLLCREQPHAFHHWTADVAPEGRWLEWYGGGKTFHQTPLYPYLIAAVYRFAGDEHLHVSLFQALLGALACWLTVLIGQRTVSARAGLFAGLLLAFCGPYFFYDAFILRDGPMAFFVALSTLALIHAVERDKLSSWCLAGASLGLFTLAKETGLPILLLTLVGVALWRRRRPVRLLQTCAVILLGWLLITSPAFARNVAVGSSPFRLSTRGPEVFVAGNAQGQTGVGWHPPTAAMRRILQDSNFSLAKAMAYTVATHRVEPWGYVELLWNKTEAFFNSHEVPNNVDFYLHRSHLTTLRLGFVSLAFLAPAALLGLLLGIPRRRKLAVPYLMFGAVAGSVIALYILARFRLQVLPLMAVFAGLTIDWFLTALAARRRVAVLCAALVFAGLATWTWSDADPFGEKNKYTGIMLKLAKIGDFEKADQYRKMLLDALGSGDADDDPIMAMRLEQLHTAFESFDQASALPERTAARHLLLAQGYADLVHVTKRGDLKDFATLSTRHYNIALSLNPDIVGAHHGLGKLAYIVANHPSLGDVTPDLGLALAHFRSELAVHPDHGESHRDAGLIFHTWSQWQPAMLHLLEAERCGIDEALVHASIAHMSINNEIPSDLVILLNGETVPVLQPSRALAHAEAALALDPDDPNVLRMVSDVFLVNRRWDEAVELLEKLIEKQPWRSGELRSRIDAFRAQQQNKQGQPETGPATEGETVSEPDGAVEPPAEPPVELPVEAQGEANDPSAPEDPR